MRKKIGISILSGLFLSALFVGALGASAHAAVQGNERFPFTDVPFFIPCANGGAGDTVIVNGEEHFLMTFTINNNHVSGTVHFQPHAVGTDTEGHMYHAVGLGEFTFGASFVNGQATGTDVLNMYLVGTAGSPTFKIHDTFHFTINANGDLTASLDNGFATCG